MPRIKHPTGTRHCLQDWWRTQKWFTTSSNEGHQFKNERSSRNQAQKPRQSGRTVRSIISCRSQQYELSIFESYLAKWVTGISGMRDRWKTRLNEVGLTWANKAINLVIVQQKTETWIQRAYGCFFWVKKKHWVKKINTSRSKHFVCLSSLTNSSYLANMPA